MIKLVVFDWNGVLIADAGICAAANNDVLIAFGCKPVSFATFQETMIVPVIDFYVRNGIDRDTLIKEADRSSEIFHKSYEMRAAKARTRRCARELLSWLSLQPIESIILSDHTMWGVENQLKRLGIREYFSHVLANSESDTSLKKLKKKERLETFLKNGSVKLNEVLIIGDSTQETEVGKAIGITTVAITGGFVSTRRLKATKPDYLISNLNQLIGIIEKLR